MRPNSEASRLTSFPFFSLEFVTIEQIHYVLRNLILAIICLLIPLFRLFEIHGDTLTAVLHIAEVIHSANVSLLCRLGQPINRKKPPKKFGGFFDCIRAPYIAVCPNYI